MHVHQKKYTLTHLDGVKIESQLPSFGLIVQFQFT